jgi:hypothetical protein
MQPGRRSFILLIVIGVLPSLGASYRTANFKVEAPTKEIARQAGDMAERHRRELAVAWLGKKLPAWQTPCSVRIKITATGGGGATTFRFDRDEVLSQDMHVEGSLDRVLNSVLRHEIAHTIFAHHFRAPVPRWADEGAAVLAEDEAERQRHELICGQIVNQPGRAMPLGRLFNLKEYPNDVMALYAQGYAVTRFLVERGGRRRFLAFVRDGMADGWDAAAKKQFGYADVAGLERAWLTDRRDRGRRAELLDTIGKAYALTGVLARLPAPVRCPPLWAARPLTPGALHSIRWQDAPALFLVGIDFLESRKQMPLEVSQRPGQATTVGLARPVWCSR